MEHLQIYLIIGIIYFILIVLFILFIFYYSKHNINLQITEFKDNLILYKTYRVRETKGNYYLMQDLFKKKPFDYKKEELQEFYIKVESMPIFGIKYVINLKKFDSEYSPYIILEEKEPKILVNDNMTAFVNEVRKDLVTATELQTSTKEQILKLLVPIGIILLAISCLIFFPKMYETVMQTGNAAANTAITSFTDKLNAFIPKG